MAPHLPVSPTAIDGQPELICGDLHDSKMMLHKGYVTPGEHDCPAVDPTALLARANAAEANVAQLSKALSAAEDENNRLQIVVAGLETQLDAERAARSGAEEREAVALDELEEYVINAAEVAALKRSSENEVHRARIKELEAELDRARGEQGTQAVQQGDTAMEEQMRKMAEDLEEQGAMQLALREEHAAAIQALEEEANERVQEAESRVAEAREDLEEMEEMMLRVEAIEIDKVLEVVQASEEWQEVGRVETRRSNMEAELQKQLQQSEARMEAMVSELNEVKARLRQKEHEADDYVETPRALQGFNTPPQTPTTPGGHKFQIDFPPFLLH